MKYENIEREDYIMATEREAYFEALDKKITEITEESALEETEDGYISRALFTTVQGGEGPALFETGFYDLWEDLPMVEIQITPDFIIEKDYLGEVEKLVMNLNFTVPLGLFGIRYSTNRLFVRYVFTPDMEKGAEELAAQTITFYEKLAIVLGNVYGIFENVATGASTYEEEAEKNELLRQ